MASFQQLLSKILFFYEDAVMIEIYHASDVCMGNIYECKKKWIGDFPEAYHMHALQRNSWLSPLINSSPTFSSSWRRRRCR